MQRKLVFDPSYEFDAYAWIYDRILWFRRFLYAEPICSTTCCGIRYSTTVLHKMPKSVVRLCKRAIMTLIINFIVLIAVVVRLPSYLLKVIRWDRSWQRLINYYKTYVGSHCQPRLQIIVSCNCKGCTYTWKKPWNIINILGLFILKMYIFVHTL